METRRVNSERLSPDQTYSVSEAARYLGIHRCYYLCISLVTHHPLPFIQVPGKVKIRFLGSDLIALRRQVSQRGRKIKGDRE